MVSSAKLSKAFVGDDDPANTRHKQEAGKSPFFVNIAYSINPTGCDISLC